ncbi:helix-turn-helix domain-containing protein [Natronospora cellulosivora (SeqCode)]
MRCKNLGERISKLRNEKGYTQAELAELIGVSRPVMVKIENAQRTVSLDEGEEISKALGISINTLLNFEKEEEEKSFFMAFKAKGMDDEQLKDIKRFEMLFDALCTQEEIYKGE